MMDIVERVARAIKPNAWGVHDILPKHRDVDPFHASDLAMSLTQARRAIDALRDTTLVYREGGEVIHELRGAPDDIWKTLLDAALTHPHPEGSSH